MTGDPVKKNMQGHEAFMLLVDDACRRYATKRFLDYCTVQDEDTSFYDVPHSRGYLLLLLKQKYIGWLDQWIDDLDEPSVVMSLFMKYV